MTSESLHRDIPVLSVPCRGPLTGSLHLGVGSRDESVTNLGVTHLLEHLLFRRMEPITVMHNGHTDQDSMSLWATGTPQEVVAFLNSAGEALRGIVDLTHAEVERELAVLATEMTDHFTDFREGLLTYRFGVMDAGLSQMGSPTMGALTPSDIVAWAGTWLTSENAVLTFTGPVPDGLDLELPRGSGRPRSAGGAALAASGEPRPRLVGSGKAGVGLSLLVGERWSSLVAEAVCAELRRELRLERSLVYCVDWYSVRATDDLRQVDIVLDPLPENLVATVAETVRTLRRAAQAGVSDQSVVTAVSVARSALSFADGAASGHVDRMAVDRLRGRTTRSLEELWEDLETVTPDVVTEAVRAALPSMIVAMCDVADVEDPELIGLGLEVDRFLGWGPDQEADGPALATFRARRFGDAPSGARLTVTSGALRLRGRDLQLAVDLTDVVLVGHRGCGCLDLVDSRGRVAKLDPDDWRKGDDLRDGLLERFGPDRVRRLPAHDPN